MSNDELNTLAWGGDLVPKALQAENPQHIVTPPSADLEKIRLQAENEQLRAEIKQRETVSDELAVRAFDLRAELDALRKENDLLKFENSVKYGTSHPGMYKSEVGCLKEELAAATLVKMHTVKLLEKAEAELASLRPAAEALKTAVELEMWIGNDGTRGYAEWWKGDKITPDDVVEMNNGDPLAATIKAITRAAEAVKENGK
jgi:hypothetical protein